MYMTLTTHALVGAAAAQLVPAHPALAFVAGFVSHLAIDSLPHWDYELLSMKRDEQNPLSHHLSFGKEFPLDLLRVGSDALLGIALSILIFSQLLETSTWLIALAGAIGGIAPDPLQFVYWLTKWKFMEPLQRFHVLIQKGKELRVHPLVGLSLQLALLLVVIPLVAYFA